MTLTEIMTDEEWNAAKSYLDNRERQYLELSTLPGVNVSFVCNMVIAPLRARYEAGERTIELYNEMIGVE